MKAQYSLMRVENIQRKLIVKSVIVIHNHVNVVVISITNLWMNNVRKITLIAGIYTLGDVISATAHHHHEIR
jgi:hypothetical protein